MENPNIDVEKEFKDVPDTFRIEYPTTTSKHPIIDMEVKDEVVFYWTKRRVGFLPVN